MIYLQDIIRIFGECYRQKGGTWVKVTEEYAKGFDYDHDDARHKEWINGWLNQVLDHQDQYDDNKMINDIKSKMQ